MYSSNDIKLKLKELHSQQKNLQGSALRGSWLVPRAPHLHPNPTLGPGLSQLPVGSTSSGKHKLPARG